MGKLELRVPQDRNGGFSTEIFERYQRSEKALVAALTQMYIQGVSTRKVQAISEELCGHSFSASAISEINKQLDAELGRFARRELESEYPYLIIDARYEKLRENGVIRSRAVLVAIGIDWEGRRQVLGVEMANRESSTSWKEFLLSLKRRGLCGVFFAVSDDHPGLKRAITEVLPEAYWQRCYVHFLRNALDYLPRKVADDCLIELRWLYDRRNAEEARRDLAAWLLRWQEKYPRLCAWVEENIEETLTFYRLPHPDRECEIVFEFLGDLTGVLPCNANDVGLLKLVSNLKQIPRSISFFSNHLRRLCIIAHGDEGGNDPGARK